MQPDRALVLSSNLQAATVYLSEVLCPAVSPDSQMTKHQQGYVV